ncbi:hypothetical protein OE88DRAFT_1637188 [Heliocybe sulcata]|uniref:Uncharacterized protein n=1 Tax=Heliocybe sulcata TaxID=5364 RepID=A0A5C3MRF4_9AGAM|nr:hypothetical protein OE88DRAFT_1637188 [Heliocybe sulcata]
MGHPSETNQPPPAYAGPGSSKATDSKSAPNEPPPDYVFPKTYKIGDKTTDVPFVDTYQLKLHLRLLRAFHDLRVTVQNIDATRLPPGVDKIDASLRWAWFLHLAVERFERWVSTLPSSSGREGPAWYELEVPPLDVLLVWHAYILNPTWYTEDGLRIESISALPRSHNTPLQILAKMGDLSTYKPSERRKMAWSNSTWTPFDPLEAMQNLTHRTVICPSCSEKLLTPFFSENGTGYAQRDFKVTCERCGLEITKQKLGVAKFARDLARPYDAAQIIAEGNHIPGTLHIPYNAANTIRATRAKDTLLRAPGFAALQLDTKSETERAKAIQEAAGYSYAGLETILSRGIRPVGQNLRRRIMSTYVDDRPFSVELVGAVLRQESFVDKMYNLGWTDPSYFASEGDELALQHAIARYHAFLDLMASSSMAFFVPTLDIDLAWHTHQLFADQYAADCKKYVGRYVDHDDKIAESELSNAFDITCRAWKSRFGIAYAHCGCPLPGDTIGIRVSLLRNRTMAKLLSSSSRPDLVPPSDSEIICAATHPSDHNAVYVLSDSDINRSLRRAKLQKRRERDQKDVEKGRADRMVYERGLDHPMPFLVPVPLYYAPACVAASGSVMYNPMSAGACASVSDLRRDYSMVLRCLNISLGMCVWRMHHIGRGSL